ncbi:MAG: hypothetical protein DRO00_08275, partial [Thermoproteota archaeon]
MGKKHRKEKKRKKFKFKGKQEPEILNARWFRIAILTSVLLLAFAMRISNKGKMSMFRGDDEYWHLHIIKQMTKLGHRPQIDKQAWFPEGREMVHPPFFHYFIYYIWRFLSTFKEVEVFDVMFNIPPFIGILGAISWFLLFKELYNDFFAGLIGAGVYAVFLPTIAPTVLGSCRPEALAEAIMPFGFWLLHLANKTRKWVLLPLPGLVFGVCALTWETSIYLYLPLVLLFLLSVLRVEKEENAKWLVLLCLCTIAMAISIALTWFLPIYLKYGLWRNTPKWLLIRTATFQRPSLRDLR